jgi:multidrug efflux pump subunit AcrA (membrane-fusion protein)
MNQLLLDLYGHQAWADAEHWRAFDAHPPALSDTALWKRLYHVHLVQRAFLRIITGEPLVFEKVDTFTPETLKAFARASAEQAAGWLHEAGSEALERRLVIPWFKDPPIEITVDAFRGEVFKGEVEAFDARLSSDSRTLMVRGRIPNPDRKLLPGMFANAAVLAGEPKHVVTVPRTALTYTLYGDSVWVVKEGVPEPTPPAPTASSEGVTSAIAADAPPAEPKLTVERRFVRVGATQGDRIAILEGVSTGEEVVTSGQLKLQPGAAIKIDNSQALKPPAELPKQ